MKPLATLPVIFNCTSDAVPATKYRFHRTDTTGEHLVSSSGSKTNGILVVSSIMYTSNVYNVTYKCTPHNMLGNGLEKKIMLDIQGMSFELTETLIIANFIFKESLLQFDYSVVYAHHSVFINKNKISCYACSTSFLKKVDEMKSF